VVAELGQSFAEPPPFDLQMSFEHSDVCTPIVFLLSSGSDPTHAFFQFAEDVGMRSKVDVISLGQGQAAAALKLIEEGKQRGRWVLLQVRC
jgi:dynein heavy chain